jgi:EmrB/QacA subfamily drug resistance transporter
VSMTSSPTTDRNRWAALYVLCAGMLMIVLDATIVNVALPSIQDDLGFSQSNLAWVVNAYLIAFGGLLLLAGRAGDLLGQRRVFVSGLTLFTVASLLCAVAQTQEMLIVARFIQGVGGALTSAVVLGMIVTMFPEPREQAKALGVYGFVASAGGSIGLLAGGVLTDLINWHWIFFINLPIGVATVLLAVRLIEARPGLGLSQGADLRGAVLLTAGLMLGVYTILGITEYGWISTRTVSLAGIAAVLLVAFVVRQGRIANPLMPLRLFRSREVTGSNLVMALLVVGMFGLFFLCALYLQRILGYSPLEVGLAFLPSTLVMGVTSLKFSMRFAPRAVIVPSMLLIAAGMLWFMRAPIDGTFVIDILPATILIGLGAGLSTPALMTLAMHDVQPSDAGLASGLVNTTVQVGGAIGLAVLATLASERTGASQAPQALLDGYQLAFLIGAAMLGLATLVALVLLRTKREPQEKWSGEYSASVT